MENEILKKFLTEAFDILPPIINSLNDSEKKSYSENLTALQKKFQDPELKLAIVGNFSCGKSTFLNALLKQEFLKTDILPTTAFATYIRRNKETVLRNAGRRLKYYNSNIPLLSWTMTDGKSYNLFSEGAIYGLQYEFKKDTGLTLPDTIQEVVHMLTASNELTGKIKKVELSFGERPNFENICLIDTPGINPGNDESKQHIFQTINVLRESSDAIVLLYDVTTANADNVEKFLRENAADFMNYAIIILTQADRLHSRKEMDRIIKKTSELVQERFKQKNPQIYSVSAWRALEYFCGYSTDEEDKQWAESFNEITNNIFSQLSIRRSEIIFQRISKLMEEIINSVSQIISSELAELEQESANLEKASTDKLETEFAALNEAYNESVSKQINFGWQMLSSNIDAIINDRFERVSVRIEFSENVEELNNCLQIFYPSIMENVGQEVKERLEFHIVEKINMYSKDYATAVETCLNKYERYLGKVNTQSVNIQNSRDFQISNIELTAVEESVLDNLNNNFGTAGLAAFIVFGPLGAAVVAGGYFLNRYLINNKKKQIQSDITENLYEYRKKLIETCKENITKISNGNLNWAKNLLATYKNNYQEIFDSIEKKHNERVAQVEFKIAQDRENIRQIENLKNFLLEN